MNCSYHPDIAATTACSVCGRNLCSNCTHQVKERIFCQDCLVQGAEWSAKARRASETGPDPRRAAWLSLAPALGAIYNGQYLKAVTHFAVFAALCIMGDDVHSVFGWAAFTFYVYMIFDSYRNAQQIRQERLAGPQASADWTPADVSSPFWGILLIVLGILFTLSNMGIIDFDFIRRLWPLVFIVVGALLLYRSLSGRSSSPSQSTSETVGNLGPWAAPKD